MPRALPPPSSSGIASLFHFRYTEAQENLEQAKVRPTRDGCTALRGPPE
jgi:hypothetical protein